MQNSSSGYSTSEDERALIYSKFNRYQKSGFEEKEASLIQSCADKARVPTLVISLLKNIFLSRLHA